MDFIIKLLSYINAAGAIHALIQSMVLLLTRRGNRRAHKFMALFLAALAVAMAHGMVSLLGLYDIWPALSILTGSIVLAFGPLFFFYIRAMTSHVRLKPVDALHGIPFLLGLTAYGAFLNGGGGNIAPSGIVDHLVRSPWIVVTVLSVIQTIVYVSAVIHLLRAHSLRVKSAYSTIDPVDLGWLRRRLAVYAFIWAAGVAMISVTGFESRAVGLIGQIVSFLIAVNTFVTGYRAMLQPEIVLGPVAAAPARRYERSSLTPENAGLYRARLIETTEREKLFLDPEITLPKLAGRLEIPVAHLSQVLNDLLDRNFYEFINRYRIEEAKRRLASPGAAGEKLITVALECGFNSLPTFNRVFKEMTGRTPSDYRRRPVTS